MNKSLNNNEKKEIIAKRRDIDSKIIENQFFAEKILYATKLFFEYAKTNLNKTQISETSYFNFLSILELESIKEKGAFFANQKIVKTENGLIPSKIFDFIKGLEINNNGKRLPLHISQIIREDNVNKTFLSFNDQFVVFDDFLSNFDKDLINKVAKTVLQDSNKFIKNYLAWKNAKINQQINIFDELNDEQRKMEMEIIYN
ncbi:hypothetical protein [Spiroplasma endosymbiont of Crioceris asparagi]|uniref:hypothetical protein n=1 Tax=Spiroplasma endosymbiont of Crioceris asparagi TaxID=3066286 RepID=UPI0030CD3496